MTIDIDKAREICEAASTGKWRWDESRESRGDRREPDYIPQCCYLNPTLIALSDTYENSDEDCRFVEYACETLPAALDEIDGLRAENKQLRELTLMLGRAEAECPKPTDEAALDRWHRAIGRAIEIEMGMSGLGLLLCETGQQLRASMQVTSEPGAAIESRTYEIPAAVQGKIDKALEQKGE